ncbi:uncharacterized protein LOC141866947 isoform X1 [Acropora palmata]|uniref:uncharacterized protein LOC141866947 isoform X1 n=1 Tax=Acropora palmata TaxID=6131 RepID=UPI003D9FEDD9
MAITRWSFWFGYFLYGWLLCLTVGNDAPVLDMNRTRKEVTTLLGQPVNLGCYTNNSGASPFLYTWTKDNVTVTESSNVQIYENMLVLTPQTSADFGIYKCHIVSGSVTTVCSISLHPGCANREGNSPSFVVTGCVNLSVLMPVLAVMMVSLLLNVHFFLQWRRRKQFLLSGEEIQFGQEFLEANDTEQMEEEVGEAEIGKNETCCVGFRRRRRKEKEDIKRRIIGHDNYHRDDEKNEEVFEMQESTCAQDSYTGGRETSQSSPGKEIPPLEDILNQPEISPIAKHSPRSLQDSPHTLNTAQESPSAEDTPRSLESPKRNEVPRLEDILSHPEISPIAKDRLESPRDSPRTLKSLRDSPRVPDIDSALAESPRGTEVPRLEDFIREEETSTDVRDQPQLSDIPRTQVIPRVEEFLWDAQTKDNNKPACSQTEAGSADSQAPRIADFFLPDDESDIERQSLDSEEPLVSHYMEKMDFEKGSGDEEHVEEPLVSHYMEKMHFEEINDDDGPQLK